MIERYKDLKEEILRILTQPNTISSVKRSLDVAKYSGINWNTIHKYCEELVIEGKLKRMGDDKFSIKIYQKI